MYVVAAVVIYYYGGKDVKSPALSSTAPITAKIAYGVAIPTVSLTLEFWNKINIESLDRDRWSDQWPCCSQVHLCPSIPWHRPHAKEKRGFHWILGSDYVDSLGHCMGHCRGNSSFQRSAQFDRECEDVYDI